MEFVAALSISCVLFQIKSSVRQKSFLSQQGFSCETIAGTLCQKFNPVLIWENGVYGIIYGFTQTNLRRLITNSRVILSPCKINEGGERASERERVIIHPTGILAEKRGEKSVFSLFLYTHIRGTRAKNNGRKLKEVLSFQSFKTNHRFN